MNQYTIVRGDTWEENIQLVSDVFYEILSTTDTDPIVLTTKQATPFETGDYIHVAGHTGNTGVFDNNGNFQITKVDPYSMSLNGSFGNGVGGAQGYIMACKDCTGVDIDTDVTTAVKLFSSAEEAITVPTPIFIQQITGLLKLSLTEEQTMVDAGRYIVSMRIVFPDNTETVWEAILIFVDAPTTPILE